MWKDGSVVKSTNCSSRGPEFSSQQSHGDSQPSIMRSDALFWCFLKTATVNLHIINKQTNKQTNKQIFFKSRDFSFLGSQCLLYFILIISSNFICNSSINLEIPLCSYYIVSKMRTHSMHMGH